MTMPGAPTPDAAAGTYAAMTTAGPACRHALAAYSRGVCGAAHAKNCKPITCDGQREDFRTFVSSARPATPPRRRVEDPGGNPQTRRSGTHGEGIMSISENRFQLGGL